MEYRFVRLNGLSEIPRPLVTMPSEMGDIYFEEGLFEHDIMLQYLLSNSVPIFYSTIEHYINVAPFLTEQFRQNLEIFKLMQSYGYVDFYFVPIGAHNGNGRIFLAVATKVKTPVDFKKHVETCKEALLLLTEAIDYIGTRKFPELFLCGSESRKIVIHPKPLILINTLAKNDLTLDQTAGKLGISIHTADKHIAAVKAALGVTTTAGAVYKAIKSGLIDYH